ALPDPVPARCVLALSPHRPRPPALLSRGHISREACPLHSPRRPHRLAWLAVTLPSLGLHHLGRRFAELPSLGAHHLDWCAVELPDDGLDHTGHMDSSTIEKHSPVSITGEASRPHRRLVPQRLASQRLIAPGRTPPRTSRTSQTDRTSQAD
ncbi:hypothetical protein, partial [Microtetraspora sp. NBRC 16547]|uniref:hypothetical protein n=1 Tax=Microtetraspora sp. NBRC 16547 TaxID=3030993 RepID=UPI002553450A